MKPDKRLGLASLRYQNAATCVNSAQARWAAARQEVQEAERACEAAREEYRNAEYNLLSIVRVTHDDPTPSA